MQEDFGEEGPDLLLASEVQDGVSGAGCLGGNHGGPYGNTARDCLRSRRRIGAAGEDDYGRVWVFLSLDSVFYGLI